MRVPLQEGKKKNPTMLFGEKVPESRSRSALASAKFSLRNDNAIASETSELCHLGDGITFPAGPFQC